MISKQTTISKSKFWFPYVLSLKQCQCKMTKERKMFKNRAQSLSIRNFFKTSILQQLESILEIHLVYKNDSRMILFTKITMNIVLAVHFYKL